MNTAAVKQLVEEHDIVPLRADWTDGSEEIGDMLRLLQSKSIPLYAIFPAGDPNRPIVLRDLVTKGQVLRALRKAGPSGSAIEATATAMNRSSP